MAQTQFHLDMLKWKDATEAQLTALARQACLQMAERVVDTTPVDTGFLRSSWQPSLDAPDASGTGDGTARIAQVAAEIAPGQKFYLLNNAVYALRIEFGFVGADSLGREYNQAGRHMVGDAVAAWPSIVRSIAAKLGMKAA